MQRHEHHRLRRHPTPSTNRWTSTSDYGPGSGRDCDGPLEKVSLGHRYQSVIAEFTFDGVPYRRDHEANWRSSLYAILEGACYALEISRDDIDGALSWNADQRRSIVLFDTVPARSGAAKKIAENIGVVLEAAVKRGDGLRLRGKDVVLRMSTYISKFSLQ